MERNYILYILLITIIIFSIILFSWLSYKAGSEQKNNQINNSSPNPEPKTQIQNNSTQDISLQKSSSLVNDILSALSSLNFLKNNSRSYQDPTMLIAQNFGLQKVDLIDKKFKLIGILYSQSTPSIKLNLYERKICRDDPLILYDRRSGSENLYGLDDYGGAKYILQDKDSFFIPLFIEECGCCSNRDFLRNGDIITNLPPYSTYTPFIVDLYKCPMKYD